MPTFPRPSGPVKAMVVFESADGHHDILELPTRQVDVNMEYDRPEYGLGYSTDRFRLSTGERLQRVELKLWLPRNGALRRTVKQPGELPLLPTQGDTSR